MPLLSLVQDLICSDSLLTINQAKRSIASVEDQTIVAPGMPAPTARDQSKSQSPSSGLCAMANTRLEKRICA